MKTALILALLSLSFITQADETKQTHKGIKAPHCKAIVEACKKAGFVKGDWKNGDGLFVHCVYPILGVPAGAKTPALKQGLTVPTIDAGDVSACKSENPNFGQKKAKK